MTPHWPFLVSTYDTVAEVYEARFLGEFDDKPHDRELLASFAAAARGTVLDLGCGPGHVGALLGLPDVIGLDLSPAMARLASRRLAGATLGDMRSLPIGTASLGAVIAFYSLIHLDRSELEGVGAELRRVLRPGGRLLLAAHEGEGTVEIDEFVGIPVPFAASLFSLDELTAWLASCGFSIELAERRPPYETERTVRLFVGATR